ncbi:MAG: hypothetical protein ACTSWK_01925 [Promethearchaeota archaeon]
MALVIGKIKCYFCGEKDGVFQSVCKYGIYGDVGKRYFYHQECLEMIEVNPEKFGHIMADRAIQINDLKEACLKKFNSSIVEKFKEKIDRLHKNNFERMMPKQW